MQAALGIALLLLTAGSAPAPSKTRGLSAAPGAVVRWTGGGIERCGRGAEQWQPIDGACYYPIDLLAPKGGIAVSRWVAGVRQDATIEVSDYPYPTQRLTVDDSKVHLSKTDLARSERESAAVGKLFPRRTPRHFTLPLLPPLAKPPAAGRFGSRRLFNNEPRSPHSGADYAAPTGTAVLATADGQVVLAAEHFFSGGSVFIDHGDGLISMYFHLSKMAVAAGGEVKRGQKIGEVGATGRATGPHLHFGLRWRGARVDPAILLAPVEKMATLASP